MSEDNMCPKCKGKVPITIGGKVLCLNCGAEMQLPHLYSDVIWPSLREVARKQYGYDGPLLDVTSKAIKQLETEKLPRIEKRKITLTVREINPNTIYELKKEMDSLLDELCAKIEEELDLAKIRKNIKQREMLMTVCSKYATRSESPPEQYKIAVEYLKSNEVLDTNDPNIQRLIKKLEEEKQKCEADWEHQHRNASAGKL